MDKKIKYLRGVLMKKCDTCNKWLRVRGQKGHFNIYKDGIGGFTDTCKKCIAKAQRPT